MRPGHRNSLEEEESPKPKRKLGKYKTKLVYLRQAIVDMVFESMALCDEINETEETILIRNEEKKYLLKKLCLLDPQVDQEVQRVINESYPQLANNSASNLTPKSSKKSKNKTNCEGRPKELKLKRKAVSYKSKNRKKVVQLVALDTTGQPMFPIHLGNLTIHSLGEIVYDRRDFHSMEAIYPVGFISTRVYVSMLDPTKKCLYTCKVYDKSGCSWFEIASENEKEPVIVGGSPDMCHSLLLQRINDTLSLNVVSTRPRGHEFFGLTHPVILNLIQSMPGTRKCTNYKWTKFEVTNTGNEYVEEQDSCLHYEALQNNISHCKFKMTEPSQPPETSMRGTNINGYYTSKM